MMTLAERAERAERLGVDLVLRRNDIEIWSADQHRSVDGCHVYYNEFDKEERLSKSEVLDDAHDWLGALRPCESYCGCYTYQEEI